MLQTKDEKFGNEISRLQEKGAKLMEENRLLKQEMMMITNGKRPGTTDNVLNNPEDHGSSPSSVTTHVNSCNSEPPLEDDGSDTSLKLGLAFF